MVPGCTRQHHVNGGGTVYISKHYQLYSQLLAVCHIATGVGKRQSHPMMSIPLLDHPFQISFV